MWQICIARSSWRVLCSRKYQSRRIPDAIMFLYVVSACVFFSAGCYDERKMAGSKGILQGASCTEVRSEGIERLCMMRRSANTRSQSLNTPSRSLITRSRSPIMRSRSPGMRSRSPGMRSRSPGMRSRSPTMRSRSHGTGNAGVSLGIEGGCQGSEGGS